ncbi:DUF4258 domain-containing protein [Brevibacillus sp. NPDC058079]|uniref:DUF4258 domain-containing protein n=1 Tax=Brevibacillus sp. NPDC058079 TaxID=3346330 RepID=UPI0036F16778
MRLIFTDHAIKRMNDRAIKKSNVASVVSKGAREFTRKGLVKATRNNRVAVFKEIGNGEYIIITVYYTSQMYQMAKCIAQMKKIGINKAFRFIMSNQRSGSKGKEKLKAMVGNLFVSFDTRNGLIL